MVLIADDEVSRDPYCARCQGERGEPLVGAALRVVTAPGKLEQGAVVVDGLLALGGTDADGACAPHDVRRVGRLEHPNDDDLFAVELSRCGDERRQRVRFLPQLLGEPRLEVEPVRGRVAVERSVVVYAEQDPAPQRVGERRHRGAELRRLRRLALALDEQVLAVCDEAAESLVVEVAEREPSEGRIGHAADCRGPLPRKGRPLTARRRAPSGRRGSSCIAAHAPPG